jgi:hypothetical protein
MTRCDMRDMCDAVFSFFLHERAYEENPKSASHVSHASRKGRGEMSTRANRGERGLGRATMTMVDTAVEILREQNPMTVRGVCYQLFNRKLIPDMGRRHTAKVSRTLVSARERGLIPWEWIVDETRPIEQRPQWSNIGAYSKAVMRSYRRD